MPGQTCPPEISCLSHEGLLHCKTQGWGSVITPSDCGLGLRVRRQGIDGAALIESVLGPLWPPDAGVQNSACPREAQGLMVEMDNVSRSHQVVGERGKLRAAEPRGRALKATGVAMEQVTLGLDLTS